MFDPNEAAIDRIRVAAAEHVQLSETGRAVPANREAIVRRRALETLVTAARSYLAFSETTDPRGVSCETNLRVAIRFAEDLLGMGGER